MGEQCSGMAFFRGELRGVGLASGPPFQQPAVDATDALGQERPYHSFLARDIALRAAYDRVAPRHVEEPFKTTRAPRPLRQRISPLHESYAMLNTYMNSPDPAFRPGQVQEA